MEATVRHIIPQSKRNNNLGCLACVVLVAMLIFLSAGNKNGYGSSPLVNSDTNKVKLLTVKFMTEEWKGIDSILKVSHYWIGREMKYADAEPLKNNLAIVINAIQVQLKAQEIQSTNNK